jgi:hypothetical protein
MNILLLNKRYGYETVIPFPLVSPLRMWEETALVFNSGKKNYSLWKSDFDDTDMILPNNTKLVLTDFKNVKELYDYIAPILNNEENKFVIENYL